MNNRRIFIGILGLSLIAITLIGWWLLSPLLKKSTVVQEQPPALPTSIQPAIPTPPSSIVNKNIVPPSIGEQREIDVQERAMRQAKAFATSLGTYSSADAFESLHAIRVQATQEMQGFLQSEQARLSQLHPTYGSSWSQSTRALSARITTEPPIAGQETIEVVVQTQQTVETGTLSRVTSFQEATLHLSRVGNNWMVSSVSWKPFEP